MLNAGSYKKKKIIVRIIVTAILAVLGFTMIVPFLWMLSSSLKIEADVMKVPIKWIPDYLYTKSYVNVWDIGGAAKTKYHFDVAYFNSLYIAAISLAGAVLTSSLAGYAFAKIKFTGSTVVFLLYLSTMMVPSQVTLVPRFVMFKSLGMMGTHWPLILPHLITITGTFLMRQYFLQIPNELKEAAVIDGANEIQIWWKIMLPIAKPSMAALAMLAFLWSWNDYLDPIVFLSNWRKYTIPVALTYFIEETGVQYSLTMAAASSALIPVFVVFLAGQKFFVKGLVAGAVKG